ncbi:hypothetical protein E2C01_033513 [Portunus trituberculatus]|uniref:Uncharacterized protein n=1 Tax=Portunus trituberculatus TaxID=210409 RepID=A0A5B7EY40_PORTR|nr:hypothetical protein [Portunus trituberculatus]
MEVSWAAAAAMVMGVVVVVVVTVSSNKSWRASPNPQVRFTTPSLAVVVSPESTGALSHFAPPLLKLWQASRRRAAKGVHHAEARRRAQPPPLIKEITLQDPSDAQRSFQLFPGGLMRPGD